MENVKDVFGPVIYEYTREQAIEDGTLVDLTEWASADKGFMGGFTCQAVVTAALWAAINAIPKSLVGIADVRGRAHDVLWMASLAARGAMSRESRSSNFVVIIPLAGVRRLSQLLHLVLEPDCVTIGFPEDF